MGAVPKVFSFISSDWKEQFSQNERGSEMLEQSQTVVKRIGCVYLPATNTNESANWYIEHLGLKLIRPVHEIQAQLRISSEQTIFLIKTPEGTNLNYIQTEGIEQCALTLEVNDFEGLYNRMKSKGANVSDIDDNAGCGLNFYAYDPTGNKLDIWGGWPK